MRADDPLAAAARADVEMRLQWAPDERAPGLRHRGG